MKTKNYLFKWLVRKIFGEKKYNNIKLMKIMLEYRFGRDYNNINKILFNFFEENSCFLDVGANMGKETVRLSRKFPNGKILAIEPVSFNYFALDSIKKKLKLNNVTTIRKAIDNKPGTANIQIPVMNSGVVVGTRSTFGQRKKLDCKCILEKVETETIDNIVKEFELNRVDYIKSDTEGHDSVVLLSGVETIKKFRPFIRVEQSWKSAEFDWLFQLGYDAYYLINHKFVQAKFEQGYHGDSFFIYKEKLLDYKIVV
jgi:FkbM family methyltransferase